MKNTTKIIKTASLAALVGALAFGCNASKTSKPEAADTSEVIKFDFGSGKVEKGYIQVPPFTEYTAERGYGLVSKGELKAVNRNGKGNLQNDFITSSDPFYFSVDLPEGNYEVTLTLGDLEGESVTTVKAESRRLMLKEVKTPPGKVETHTFAVNVRTPRINEEENIRLKSREVGYLNWDNKLTLEFNNSRPAVAAIEIKKAADDVVTMYLAGNSTVVDQEYEPWAAWGQMIPNFFNEKVAVANYAESGEALKSFAAAKRLAKIISTIKEGDYLFIEFAHNDQKPASSAYVEPWTGYKEQLKLFIKAAKAKGANPVLVTSMHRRRFDENGKIINTLGDYPAAVRETAKEENIPYIDLNAMSKEFYEAMGPEESKKAFVHYPANTFPGQDKALADDTHFSTYGAWQLAKMVVEGIKKNNIGLEDHLREDVQPFNPARPDSFEEWNLPRSPDVTVVKPDGN